MDFNPFFLVELTVIFFVAIACAQNIDEEVVDILDNNYESSNSNDITTNTNNSNNINDIINNIDNNNKLENVDALSTSSSEEYFEQSLDQNDHLSSIPTISTEGELSVMSFYFTTVLLLLTLIKTTISNNQQLH
jgi:hypothetical protein